MPKGAGGWSKRDGEANLIGKKGVIWSDFNDGVTISLPFQQEFENANKGVHLSRGESRAVILSIKGEDYQATFRNVKKTDTQKDTLQIMIRTNPKLKLLLRDELKTTFDYIQKERNRSKGKGKKQPHVTVPEHSAAYLEFYKTEKPFHYRVEIIPPIGSRGPGEVDKIKLSDSEKEVVVEPVDPPAEYVNENETHDPRN